MQDISSDDPDARPNNQKLRGRVKGQPRIHANGRACGLTPNFQQRPPDHLVGWLPHGLELD
jgi:hypothetical protein